MGQKFLTQSEQKAFDVLITSFSKLKESEPEGIFGVRNIIKMRTIIDQLHKYRNKLARWNEEAIEHTIKTKEPITSKTECIEFDDSYKLFNTPTNPRVFYKNKELRKSYANGYINIYIPTLRRVVGLHRVVYCANHNIPMKDWAKIKDVAHIDHNRRHNNIENIDSMSHQANCNSKSCHTTMNADKLLANPNVKPIQSLSILRGNRKNKQPNPTNYIVQNLAYNIATRDIWQKKDETSQLYTLIKGNNGYNLYACEILKDKYCHVLFGRKKVLKAIEVELLEQEQEEEEQEEEEQELDERERLQKDLGELEYVIKSHEERLKELRQLVQLKRTCTIENEIEEEEDELCALNDRMDQIERCLEDLSLQNE